MGFAREAFRRAEQDWRTTSDANARFERDMQNKAMELEYAKVGMDYPTGRMWDTEQSRGQIFQDRQKKLRQEKQGYDVEKLKLQNRNVDLQEKQYNDAADNEYYRRKRVFDVQAGNMNPDTYAALYGGMAGGDGGGLRGRQGSNGQGQGQVGDKEILELITKAYENRDPTDKSPFENYVADMLPAMRKQFGVGEQQQQMTAVQIDEAQKKKRDMNFNDNISMSRDAAGKMRFTDKPNTNMGDWTSDVKGWGDIKGVVNASRRNNPAYPSFTNPVTQQMQLGNNPSNPSATPFYSPPATRLQMGSQSAMQPAVTPVSPKVTFGSQLSGGVVTPPVNKNMNVDLLPKPNLKREPVDWKEERKKRGISTQWGSSYQ